MDNMSWIRLITSLYRPSISLLLELLDPGYPPLPPDGLKEEAQYAARVSCACEVGCCSAHAQQGTFTVARHPSNLLSVLTCHNEVAAVGLLNYDTLRNWSQKCSLGKAESKQCSRLLLCYRLRMGHQLRTNQRFIAFTTGHRNTRSTELSED